jgi:hypothetical protein
MPIRKQADFRRAYEAEFESIVTGGEVLPDGTMLELVRNPADPKEGMLLQWKDGRSVISKEIRLEVNRFIPLQRDARLIQHLPVKAEPYGSTEALFHETVEFIEEFSGLKGDEVTLLSFFSFCSFFPDCVSMSPCVLVHGSSPTECISLLRVLGCICRHPVLLASAALSGLPEQLTPTRLICQSDSTVEKFLAVLQFPGFRVAHAQGLRQLSGATAINVSTAELKSAFTSSCIWLHVPPVGKSFSTQDEQRVAPRIDELQNRLLDYRLQNYPKVSTSTFDVPAFAGSTRDLARTLGACIIDASELQARLVRLLQTRDEAERVGRTSTLDCVVVEALVVCCHERRPSVHVAQLTGLVNAILSRNREVLNLGERQVGTILKKLGFRTTKLDKNGRGIYLLNGQCARIHELARSYGVPTVARGGLPGCPYCHPPRNCEHDAQDERLIGILECEQAKGET